jgi:translation initiation factor 1
MVEICKTCGLPKELCVCEQIALESQKIVAKIEKKKFGKKYTIIDGINSNDVDVKDIAKKLKSKFACGGTAKGDTVELQGDHLGRIFDELVVLGFAPEQIEIQKNAKFKKRR